MSRELFMVKPNKPYAIANLRGKEPTNKLYKSILRLIQVLEHDRGTIRLHFIQTLKSYENISDQVVQISMTGLIHLINKPAGRGETNYYYYKTLKKLKSFKMSPETRKTYKEILLIAEKREYVEYQNEIADSLKESQKPIIAGGCYIATMVYKDYDHPKVMVLRNFRDTFLTKYFLGRVFIRWYYRYSPSLVELLKDKKAINRMIEKILNCVIKLVDKNTS